MGTPRAHADLDQMGSTQEAVLDPPDRALECRADRDARRQARHNEWLIMGVSYGELGRL